MAASVRRWPKRTRTSPGCAHSGDRYENAEVFDAGDELLAESCISADIHVHEQAARIELDSGDGCGCGCRVDGHVLCLSVPPGHLPGSKTRTASRGRRVQTGSSGFEQRVAVRACAHECASMEVCVKADRGRTEAGAGLPRRGSGADGRSWRPAGRDSSRVFGDGQESLLSYALPGIARHVVRDHEWARRGARSQLLGPQRYRNR
jgi:hypothetical protein